MQAKGFQAVNSVRESISLPWVTRGPPRLKQETARRERRNIRPWVSTDKISSESHHQGRRQVGSEASSAQGHGVGEWQNQNTEEPLALAGEAES